MFKILSHNELEIVELLWSEGRALTRAEIIDLSPDKSWKPSAIHILLNSLLKKEMIKVEGFKPTGKNYGRTYAAAITPAQHAAQVFESQIPAGSPWEIALKDLFQRMLDIRPPDKKTLDELQQILDQKKRETLS